MKQGAGMFWWLCGVVAAISTFYVWENSGPIHNTNKELGRYYYKHDKCKVRTQNQGTSNLYNCESGKEYYSVTDVEYKK